MTDSRLIDTLLTRRSVLAANLCEPGPSDGDLEQLLQAAHRVPDHGKIGPWRFIVFKGASRAQFGKVLKARFAELNPDAKEKLLEFESERFTRAPLVIGVVSSPVEHKVPTWEQELAVGAVCQNLLLAATALGFSGQWLTEWYAFDEAINTELGLQSSERMAGFIYIGSATEAPTERVRPSLEERVSYWGE